MPQGESWYQIFEKLGVSVIKRDSFKDSKGKTVFVATVRVGHNSSENNFCSDTFPTEQKILEVLSAYE